MAYTSEDKKKLIDQFKDVTILLLIAASFISIAIGEAQDSLVILAIVIINAANAIDSTHRMACCL